MNIKEKKVKLAKLELSNQIITITGTLARLGFIDSKRVFPMAHAILHRTRSFSVEIGLLGWEGADKICPERYLYERTFLDLKLGRARMVSFFEGFILSPRGYVLSLLEKERGKKFYKTLLVGDYGKPLFSVDLCVDGKVAEEFVV